MSTFVLRISVALNVAVNAVSERFTEAVKGIPRCREPGSWLACATLLPQIENRKARQHTGPVPH